ncbi:hypothetical protein [Taibaiella soli]|uniref:Uncharacterized protein n=1 Tax=Taibaiella soli TaxID=1649169 RepID=A0A2W2AU74_9BACT|nr:hypothetical protein [Taibaiella soli]PZF71268.1 hypothetical protein DN068_18390 [Taibaiella soli]
MALQIKIHQPFTEQYTLLIDADTKAVNAQLTSRSLIRWDVNFINVAADQIEMRLLLTDHILLQANNPLIKEVAALTKAMGRMYSELHLFIDHNGIIKEVLNMDIILSKWEQAKKEMSKVADANPDIKKVILLNDSIFYNADNLKAGIQKSEFFLVYFNKLYNQVFPCVSPKYIKPNPFTTANLQWETFVRQEQVQNGVLVLEVQSTPDIPTDFNKLAYSQFADKIDIQKLKPVIIERGRYIIDHKTGRLIEAILGTQETADKEQLYTRLTYTLMSEAIYRQELSQNEISDAWVINQEPIAPAFSKSMTHAEYSIWLYERDVARRKLKEAEKKNKPKKWWQ